ncbi:hypothetical protein BJ684DRAFT_15641 [Piptocephalis cylindrospora]|uniref:SCD domain-containing protein n=1 Tax=Piptocephalis cylindrospora TaxID=1907219 RepID=A0A4P9Y5A6_9FUNG|nr:hypothetical protein BJ684DRAFT_15641 [Piptocephalis cylindrospora]|eukprot:RKP14004.1 hypothetical protein BJ684DRAFT_15641 [Piptocephalis cylindrospora]
MPEHPSLFDPEVLSAPESKVSSLTYSLLRLHERDPDQAFHAFMALMFHAGGAETFTLSSATLQDQGNVASALEDLYSTIQETTLPSPNLTGEYPLGKKGKMGRKAAERFLDIVDRFIRALHSKGELWDVSSIDNEEASEDTGRLDDRQYFLPRLEEWLVPLTRHSCTLATLQILQTITSIGRHITKRITLSQRQTDGLGRDGRRNRRYDTLKKGLSSLTQGRSTCHSHMEGLIDGVFIHRCRDVFPILRAESIKALLNCIVTYPIYFLEESFLPYLEAALEDESSLVRAEAVQGICRIYGENVLGEGKGGRGSLGTDMDEGGLSDAEENHSEDEDEENVSEIHNVWGKRSGKSTAGGGRGRGAAGVFGNRIKGLLYDMVIPDKDESTSREEDATVRKSLFRAIQLIGETRGQGMWKESEMRALSLLLLSEEEAGRRRLAPLASRYIQEIYLPSPSSSHGWVEGMARWWTEAIEEIGCADKDGSNIPHEAMEEGAQQPSEILDLITQSHGIDPSMAPTKLMGSGIESVRMATQSLIPHLPILKDWKSQVDYLLGDQTLTVQLEEKEQEIRDHWVLVMLGEVIRLTHASSSGNTRARGTRGGILEEDATGVKVATEEEEELHAYLMSVPSHRLLRLLQRLRNRSKDRALLVQGILVDSHWGWWRGEGRGMKAKPILILLEEILDQMRGECESADWMIHSARCIGKCLADEGGSWIRDRLEGQVVTWITSLSEDPTDMLRWMAMMMRYRDMEDLVRRQGALALDAPLWDRVNEAMSQVDDSAGQQVGPAIDLVLLRSLWWIQRYIRSHGQHEALFEDEESALRDENRTSTDDIRSMSGWVDRAMNSLKSILQSRIEERATCRKAWQALSHLILLRSSEALSAYPHLQGTMYLEAAEWVGIDYGSVVEEWGIEELSRLALEARQEGHRGSRMGQERCHHHAALLAGAIYRLGIRGLMRMDGPGSVVLAHTGELGDVYDVICRKLLQKRQGWVEQGSEAYGAVVGQALVRKLSRTSQDLDEKDGEEEELIVASPEATVSTLIRLIGQASRAGTIGGRWIVEVHRLVLRASAGQVRGLAPTGAVSKGRVELGRWLSALIPLVNRGTLGSEEAESILGEVKTLDPKRMRGSGAQGYVRALIKATERTQGPQEGPTRPGPTKENDLGSSSEEEEEEEQSEGSPKKRVRAMGDETERVNASASPADIPHPSRASKRRRRSEIMGDEDEYPEGDENVMA